MNENNFNVDGFLRTLEQNQSKPKELGPTLRSLEKIYLSYPGNYGKYQIFPMNSVVTGYPFVILKDTREIKITKKNVLPDGTENVFDAWIKILPVDAYQMLDSTGRVVSSLTADDENLLIQASGVFDQLYEELGGNQKDQKLNKAISLLRRRNYTIFHGKCLNKWSFKDPRNAERTNFPALFICSAKGFSQTIQESINDASISHGGDFNWLEQIYNRQLSGRGGYLIFSIAMGIAGKVGYTITATHETDKFQYLSSYSVTEEEAEMMKDPVETFLGWQAGRNNNPGQLFNRNLIQETIDLMSRQLAAVRMARSTGADVLEAMNATTNEALKNQVPIGGMQTNDPIIAAQTDYQGANTMTNPEAVMNGNVNPYSNPPAAQIDPITQNPINGGNTPYVQPNFAKPGNNFNPNPGNPFETSGPVTNPFGN